MSHILYRGSFSDAYELMCNWQWDPSDNTLEVSVWNYNMDTIGPIDATKALYDRIGKLVVHIMKENVKIKRITQNMATLSLAHIPPLEKQRKIAADVMALLSNKIIRWEVRISTGLQDSLYRQSWICKHNVLSMLDIAAIRLAEEDNEYDIPEHLAELVKTWRTKMEFCRGYSRGLKARCLKQKELEEIVANLPKMEQ